LTGHGQGECVIADSHYQVIKRLQAGHGYAADLAVSKPLRAADPDTIAPSHQVSTGLP
jgi:hypothetical protein